MSYLDEMKESFKEVRSRIYAAGRQFEQGKIQQKPTPKTDKEMAAESVKKWREREAKRAQKEAERRAEVMERRRRQAVLAKIDAKMAAKLSEPRTSTVAEILEEVSREHGVSIIDIKSSRRARPIVHARHEAMWRACKETTLSLPAIATALGGKDHTTILHAARKYDAMLRGERYVRNRGPSKNTPVTE